METEKYLLTITENGFFKMSPMSEMKVQQRGGSGMKVCSLNEKTGKLAVAITAEKLSGSVLVVTSAGTGTIFPIENARVMGRTATGVRAIRVKEGEKVISLDIV